MVLVMLRVSVRTRRGLAGSRQRFWISLGHVQFAVWGDVGREAEQQRAGSQLESRAEERSNNVLVGRSAKSYNAQSRISRSPSATQQVQLCDGFGGHPAVVQAATTRQQKPQT